MIWWLSFINPTKQRGSQFLGVVILDADSLGHAIQRAWQLKINPGGECMGIELPEEARAEHAPYMDRLLTEEEAMQIGMRQDEAEKKYGETIAKRVDEVARIVCNNCNPKRE